MSVPYFNPTSYIPGCRIIANAFNKYVRARLRDLRFYVTERDDIIILPDLSFYKLLVHDQDHIVARGYLCPSMQREFESSDTHL